MFNYLETSKLTSEINSDEEQCTDEYNPVSLTKRRKKTFRPSIKLTSPVILILDLDETCIDKNVKAFHNLTYFLLSLRKVSKTMILWTAGNEAHAKHFISKLNENSETKNIFDHVLAKTEFEKKSISLLKRILSTVNYKLDEKIPTVLIDDNEKYLNTGRYDININVSEFYLNLDDPNNYFVDYDRLLAYLQKQVNK